MGLFDIIWDGTNYVAIGDGEIFVVSADLSTIVATYTCYDIGSNILRYNNGILYVMGTSQNSVITYSADKNTEYLENLTKVTCENFYTVEESIVEDGVIYCVIGSHNSDNANLSMAKITLKDSVAIINRSDDLPVINSAYTVHYSVPISKPGEFMLTGATNPYTDYDEPAFILIATKDGSSFVGKAYDEIPHTFLKVNMNERHIILATNSSDNGFYYAVNTL